MKKVWKRTGATCPRCNGETESLIVTEAREDDTKEHEYEDAERCPHCRRIIDFTADEIICRPY